VIVVFHDELSIEEADSLLRRRGGETDELRRSIRSCSARDYEAAVTFIGSQKVGGAVLRVISVAAQFGQPPKIAFMNHSIFGEGRHSSNSLTTGTCSA
jgi:hypothetical protein